MKFSIEKGSFLALIAFSYLLVTPGVLAQSAENCIADNGQLEGHVSPLQGEISLDVSTDPVTKYINDLTDTALKNDENIRTINQYVDKFKGLKHAIVHRSKDALNYVILYKGVSQSSEASDVILDEKQKLTGRGSAEYLRQKLIDRAGLAVTQAVLELAMGLGNADAKSGAEQVETATQKLTSLLGATKCDEAISSLKDMLNKNSVADETWNQKPWSISQKSDRQNYLVDVSVATDPVCQQIVGYLHKYNHVSKLNRGSQKLVRTSLGLASLTPTLVAPAAQTALFVWVMASGGSEEDKLLKEVYLGRTLDTRNKSISEKAHLALEYYQLSLLTKNPALHYCCRSLVKQMAGDTNSAGVLSAGAFISQQPLKEEKISLGDEKKHKTKTKPKTKTASNTIAE